MYLCNSGHPEVCYVGIANPQGCPVCVEKASSMEQKQNDTDTISELAEQIEELMGGDNS